MCILPSAGRFGTYKSLESAMANCCQLSLCYREGETSKGFLKRAARSRIMEYEGSATIPSNRADVWDPITDPEVLISCIMGAQEVTRISERKYEGLIQQSVAGITVSMEGEVEIQDMDRPERLTFFGTGSDSRTGSRMDADVEVHLMEDGDEMVMDYTVDITFTGKLATLGSRILKRQVKVNVETYFDNLVEYITETQ